MATTDTLTGSAAPARRSLRPDRVRAAEILSALAALAATVAAACSLLRPALLRGVAVTDGNLRGTALVVLAVGVPLVLAAAYRSHRGSPVAVVAWLAGLTYLGYQGVLFCFGTPMNRLFPAYVALLGLAGWATVALVHAIDVDALAARLGPVSRSVPVTLGMIAALNTVAWLARALPVAWTGDPPDSVTDSGLDTSPVLVQDLTLWLPLAAVAALLAWRGSPWGTLLASAMLLFYAVEGLSVASDQWWGVRADDTRPAVAALETVPVGIVLAVALGGLWLWALTRGVRRPSKSSPR